MEIEVQEKKHSYYTKSDHLGAMMRQIILSVYILFNLHLRQGMEQGSGEAMFFFLLSVHFIFFKFMHDVQPSSLSNSVMFSFLYIHFQWETTFLLLNTNSEDKARKKICNQ